MQILFVLTCITSGNLEGLVGKESNFSLPYYFLCPWKPPLPFPIAFPLFQSHCLFPINRQPTFTCSPIFSCPPSLCIGKLMPNCVVADSYWTRPTFMVGNLQGLVGGTSSPPVPSLQYSFFLLLETSTSSALFLSQSFTNLAFICLSS